MQHSFDIDIATKYDVNVAIFLNNMAFWIKKNQANSKHFHEGRYWTYNSMEAYTEIFPYWSFKQIRRLIDKLKSEGLILIGNFNQKNYDRTQWYALTDLASELMGFPICPNGQIDLPKRADAFAEKGKAIPDINTDIKPDNKSLWPSGDDRDKFESFWSVFPKKAAKKDAIKAWKKNNLHEKADLIIADVVKRTQSDWAFRDKNHIPHPATYLNGERWNDEIINQAGDKRHVRESVGEKSSRLLRESYEREVAAEQLQRDGQYGAKAHANELDYHPFSAVPGNLG